MIGDEPTHEETDRRRHVQRTTGNQNEGQETPWPGKATTQNPQPDSVEEVENDLDRNIWDRKIALDNQGEYNDQSRLN